LEIDPDAAELWGRLAISLYERGRFEESEQAAHKSLALCPRASTALRALSFIYGARGDREKEAHYQERAAEAVPMNRDCEPGFDAATLLREGNIEGAIAEYRKQMRSDLPVFAASARKSLLRLLVDHRRWEQARELVNEIESAGDSHPTLDALKCRVMFEEGRREEALSAMRLQTEGEDLQTEIWPIALSLYLRAKSEPDVEALVGRLCEAPLGNATNLAQCINLLLNAGYRPQAWRLANSGNGWCANAPTVLRAGINVSAVHGDFVGALRRYRRLPLGRRQGLSVSKIITSCALRLRCL
jgi:tetratricopeptide (TPR) repeat protein